MFKIQSRFIRFQTMKENKFFRVLHIFILYGFLVAPLYDQLGAHPTFFVAHDAGYDAMVSWAVYLSFVIPAALGLAGTFIATLNRKAGVFFHAFVIAILVSLISLHFIREIDVAGEVLIAISVALGLGFSALYTFTAKVREFINYASPIIIALPLIFLFLSPSARIGNYSESGTILGVNVDKPAPIVFIVFDELGVPVLLDDSGEIDGVRFPSFGRLANTGTWYPKATSVHASTEAAVPAILTGLLKNDSTMAPIQFDHPNNLFTWLGAKFELNVSESITKLCPDELCNINADDQAEEKPSSLREDTFIVYMHLTLPASIAELYLPSIGASWSEFNFNEGELIEDYTDSTLVVDNSPQIESAIEADNPKVVSSDGQRDFHIDGVGKRFNRIDSFIKAINPSSQPAIHFIHVKLPHVPYEYLPSGRTYLRDNITFPDGVVSDKNPWTDKEELVTLGAQRYLLQVGFVDAMLGRILDQLEANELFERSMILVTSDHGVSNRPKQFRRRATITNFEDILSIPLLIKYPYQKQKVKNTIHASTIDIIPTIAEVIEADLPWDVDGYSLLDEDFPDRINSPILNGFVLFDTVASKWMDYKEIPVSSFDLSNELKEQRAIFPANVPADKSVPLFEHNSWLGLPLLPQNIGRPSTIKSFVDNNLPLFENVRLNSGFIPAYFKTQLDIDSEVLVAIVLNGKIASIVSTVEYDGEPGFLSTMLPEGIFVEGRNDLKLYSVSEVGGELMFHPIPRRGASKEKDPRSEKARYFSGNTFERRKIKPPKVGEDYRIELVIKSDAPYTQLYKNTESTPPMPFIGAGLYIYEHSAGYNLSVIDKAGSKKYINLACNPRHWNTIDVLKQGENLSITLNGKELVSILAGDNFAPNVSVGRGYNRYWKGWVEKLSIKYITNGTESTAYSFQ